ncbi:MAG: peptidoglycan-binding domain-containing protein [Candidatus Paceibacterota bacterium]|jgi:hypothetical protein
MKIKTLIEYITQPRFRSAIPDPRPSEERALDHVHGRDVAFAGELKVNDKPVDLPFTPYNQYQTSSCGAHDAAHGRRLEDGSDVAPLPWYRMRSNYPDEGMFVHDVLRLKQKAKPVPYSAFPTERYSPEAKANAIPAQELWDESRDKSHAYVYIQPFDADAVFQAVSKGFPVTISFFATYSEWSKQVLSIEDPDLVFYLANVRHYVEAMPSSIYSEGGKLYLSALESARQGGHMRREITPEFLKKRMFLGGGYAYRKEEPKPVPVATLPLAECQYGQSSAAVKILQAYLCSKGLMLPEHRTGYYGPITAGAVLKWQLANVKTVSQQSLRDLGGRYWGPASVKAIGIIK